MLATVAWLLAFGLLSAQNDITVQASQAVYLGKTRALGAEVMLTPELNQKKKDKKKNWPKEIGNFKGNVPMPIVNENALPVGVDPVRQYANSILSQEGEPIELIVDRDGTNISQSGAVPPDPVGAVGNNNFVQMVNGGGSVILVTDKDGNTTAGPFSSNTIWSSINRAGAGDPMILWDQEAERWFILELGNDFTSMLLAISETDDPTGVYTAYQIISPGLPDYPKIGIWTTGCSYKCLGENR